METKIAEVFKLAYLINTQGKYTPFVRYFGHTYGMEIEIYEGEWVSKKEPVLDVEIHFDRRNAEEKLETLIAELKQL